MPNLNDLKQIFSDCLAIPLESVRSGLSQDNLPQWDSVTMVNLISEIEQEFNVAFQPAELVGFRTFDLVVEILRDKGVPFS